MLTRIFKNSDRLIYLILPFFGLIVWIFSFFMLGNEKTGFPSSLLLSFIPQAFPGALTLKVINLVLTIGGVLLLNFLCQYHEVTEKQNSLPAFVYLLLCAMLNSQSILHPLLIGNILLLLAFFKFFGAYRSDNAMAVSFDASFLLSCATLVYWPFLFLLPVAFIALMILKTVKFREFLLSVTGLILPFFITATLLWVCNVELGIWNKNFDSAFTSFHTPRWEKGSFLINSGILFLLFLSLVSAMVTGFGNKVKTKKIRYVLLWMCIPGAAVVFFTAETPVFIGIAAIIPLSVFIGDYLGNIKKPGIADFLLLILITVFVFSNLQTAGIL
jgi:hypothetical protein